MKTDRLEIIWYASLYEVKRRHRMSYIQEGNSIEILFNKTAKPDLLDRYFTKSEQKVLLSVDWRKRAEELAGKMKQQDISLCSYEMSGYPKLLRDIPDPPYALFYKGALPQDNRFCVGVIGARMCTEYGRRIASELGRRLAGVGIGVISGMAAGVDSASHAGALLSEGRTYAVLGCGCDICYPSSSRNVYQQIPNAGGVISEYMPGTKPLPGFFPERNRIISGLSDVLVVVEARQKSGTLITVDCALDQGRDIYAVPGRIGDLTSKGCHKLIEQGASILYDPDRFVEEMQQKAASKNKSFDMFPEAPDAHIYNKPLEKEEQLVYSCLDLHPKNVFILLEETGLQLDTLLSVLTGLSDRGLAEETQRNAFTKTMVEA